MAHSRRLRCSWRGCAAWWIRAFAVALPALVGCAAATAQALISPVLIEFKPKQKVATIRVALSDKATRPMRLQAQLLSWRQDARGAAITQPSEDLVVTPRIADIRPGSQQVLRLALRGSLPADTEMAYRLVLEDIEEGTTVDAGGGAAIKFRMAYDLPVLVAPRGPVVGALRWRDCATTAPRVANGACVQLVNAGNRRVKVQTMMLAGDGWRKSIDLGAGEAVLAGDEREWSVGALASGPVRSVRVRMAGGEELQAEPAEN